MTEEQLKFWLLVWGAGLSTILGLIKLWETLWRDRIKLSTTYSFTSADQVDDEITIVNLSDRTVQVEHWSLAWQHAFSASSVTDLTPDNGGYRFTIDPKSEHTIRFSDADKFDWGSRAAKGRKMYLTLFLFGRRRPMKLLVKAD
jgi:hypothetical protein